MRAELKTLFSPDIDLDNYWPDDEENFTFLLQALIGPEGEESQESFSFQVCTPRWLLDNRRSLGPIFGRHMLMVFDYDLQLIESKIAGLCERHLGSNWTEIAQKLSQFGQWEFEDYEVSGDRLRPVKKAPSTT